MSHRKNVLKSLEKYGTVKQIRTLSDIPKTDYIYTLVNGDSVLQIGKSGPRSKGRLKLVFRDSIVGKHNKAFICGLYPALTATDNEYYTIALTKGQDKSTVESAVHRDMGITTNIQAATFIDDLAYAGIATFHRALWDKFAQHSNYLEMDEIERLMAYELYELVTFGTSKIKRTSNNFVSSKQADNLEGNILKCLDKRYLTTIWLKMCNHYFRYGNAHAISDVEFRAAKVNYRYEKQGKPFQVIGRSR